MNKFQKVGIAIAFASSMVFAQGSPWWTANAPYGQVAFPWVVTCQDDPTKFDPEISDNECYKTLGGWWFGYIAGPVKGPNTNGCRVDMAGVTPGTSVATNYVKAKINGNWVSFMGPDYQNCEGPDVTNRANGDSYLIDGYLEVKLAVGAGDAVKYQPSIAALATNLSTPSGGNMGTVIPTFVPRDMTQYTDGLCLKYESDHEAVDFWLVLGWDETDAEEALGGKSKFKYDTWYAKIPEGSGVQTVDFAWTNKAGCTDAKNCGNFKQAQWSEAAALDIEQATKKMMSVKINYQDYAPGEINFKLYAFGPRGTCGNSMGGNNPVIFSRNIPNSVSFAMSGKVLTASIAKPAVVQVYNLQGAMVKSQALTPNSNTMNLSNLPTGIYMVRAPSLGYTGRIVVK